MDVKELPEDKENGNAWNATTTATKAGKNKDWGNAIIVKDKATPTTGSIPAFKERDFLLARPIISYSCFLFSNWFVKQGWHSQLKLDPS